MIEEHSKFDWGENPLDCDKAYEIRYLESQDFPTIFKVRESKLFSVTCFNEIIRKNEV